MFGRNNNGGGSGLKANSRNNSNANLRGGNGNSGGGYGNSNNNSTSNNSFGGGNQYGSSNMSRGNSRSELETIESDADSAVSSVFSTSTNRQAPSSLGGATSLTGGMESLGSGKGNTGGNGLHMNDASLGHDSNHTLGNIANEMIDGYNTNANAPGQRRDTLYEDARESQTPIPGAQPQNYNSNSHGNNRQQQQQQQPEQQRNDGNRLGMDGNQQQSNVRFDNVQQSAAKQGQGMTRQGSNSNKNSNNHKNGNSTSTDANIHTVNNLGNSSSSSNNNNNNNNSGNTSSPRGGNRASITGNASVDEWGSRGGAGLANASQFEQTDAASFIGQDPVAQAGDFMDEDADVTFISSEMGSGANRQPMTRFRLHSVNLNVHSPVLSELVDERANDKEDVQLEEDAATLKLLFGLLYNRSAPALGMNEWQVVLRLARCAQKYDVARAKEVAAAYFTEQEQLGALSPFMTYAFAVQYKLPALEEAAAERSVKYDLQRLPELVFNMMGFSAFQSLATFHSRRQAHYQDVLNNIAVDPKELADQCYQTGGVCVVSPLSRLKNKLAWPRQSGRDGSKRPPEPADVLRKLVTEIGQIDCGTCAKALVEGALQVQLAMESMPSYTEAEDAF